MLRLTTLLTIAMLTLLPLTSCQQAENAADQAKDTAGEAVDQAKDTATDAADKVKDTATDATDKATMLTGINNMKDGVTTTIASVQAGDFSKAKEDFTKVQESWKTVGETMKDNPQYSAISEDVTNIQASLSGEKPDSGKVVESLQGLLKNLGSAVKG
ncbi:MAG: hypothetical protein WA902_21020 [Thermosynechococcaceae cyanobacterium]